MTVQVKICGLTRPEDAAALIGAGVDFAGLVFHPRSPRNLRREQARAIAEQLRGRVRIVALLADPSDEDIAEALAAAKPDFLQLHGLESPGRVASIRTKFGQPVIKAIKIADESDFAPLADYESVADMLLFDAKPPSQAPVPGGHGHAFDWQLLRKRTIRRPWLLAGGLRTDNVARAIRSTGAPGVDASSGIESEPGIKDHGAVRAFVAAARVAQSATEFTA